MTRIKLTESVDARNARLNAAQIQAIRSQNLAAYWAQQARQLSAGSDWASWWQQEGREQAIACQEYAALSAARARSILCD